MRIHQDARLFWASPREGESVNYSFSDGRYGFVQLVRGQAEFQGEILKEGDGVELSNVSTLTIKALSDTDILLFDLA